jgi:hypothetical protein
MHEAFKPYGGPDEALSKEDNAVYVEIARADKGKLRLHSITFYQLGSEDHYHFRRRHISFRLRRSPCGQARKWDAAMYGDQVGSVPLREGVTPRPDSSVVVAQLLRPRRTTLLFLNVSHRAGKDREELLDVFGRQRPRLRDDILGRVAVCAQGP